tara:strand:- start:41 stop:883 length:843 start_codon:yes stop_codon:yes gene_type:complete
MSIIIISNNGDFSTGDLALWLEYYKADYYRINGSIQTDQTIALEIGENKPDLNYYGIDNVNIVWHRRDDIHYLNGATNEVLKLPEDTYKQMLNLNKIELKHFKNSILSNFKNAEIVPNIELNPNKLELLNLASECDIQIPKTLVTNSKEELISFKQKNKQIITKSIYNLLQLKIENQYFINYTVKVTDNDISNLPDFFFPSLFQEVVDKKVELRIFYLDGEFYSMAMFSQKNENTSLDFRHYDDDNPTRCVPNKLPNEIEKKLEDFMKKSNLKTGSIDMI